MIVIIFFVSGGQQSDAGGDLGFCGYILLFWSMISSISMFQVGSSQMMEVSSASMVTNSGYCLRLLSSIFLFQVGSSQMQEVA